MEEIIKVNEDNMTVSARELHEKVGSTERFSAWFERQLQYGFRENADYVGRKTFNALAHQELQDYNCSVEMAKEICMIQKNDKARTIRRYLIALEDAWNTPEQIMARALKVADQTINALHTRITIMEPKANYYDQLCDKGTCSNIRDTAKEFGIGQKQLVNWLIDNNYIYRASNGLRPYMDYTEAGKGYFTLKDTHNTNNRWSGQQMYITVKGKDELRKLLNTAMVTI